MLLADSSTDWFWVNIHLYPSGTPVIGATFKISSTNNSQSWTCYSVILVPTGDEETLATLNEIMEICLSSRFILFIFSEKNKWRQIVIHVRVRGGLSSFSFFSQLPVIHGNGSLKYYEYTEVLLLWWRISQPSSHQVKETCFSVPTATQCLFLLPLLYYNEYFCWKFKLMQFDMKILIKYLNSSSPSHRKIYASGDLF